MAVEIASAYIALIPTTKGIKGQLEREFGQEAKQAAGKAADALEEGIGQGSARAARAVSVAISSIGSAAIVTGLKRATDAASDLQQAVGGTASVFQGAAAAVDEFAEGAADSIGLSNRAARELTSQIGASLKGYGFAVDEAAAKSIELAELGADLSATFGGSTAEAVSALGSALRGEFDPLERYGVALRQQAIDARAVELGLAAGTGEVDAHARAQAALSLILEQSADAQGAYIREFDSAAAVAGRATANTEDAAASLGDAILPIYARTAEVVSDIAGFFAELPDSVQTGIVALAGVTAVAGPLTNVLSLYRTIRPITTQATAAVAAFGDSASNSARSVSDLYDNGTKGSTALRGMAVAGGALAAVGLAATLYEIGQAANEVTVDLEGAAGATTDELVETFEVLEGFSGRGAAQDAFRQLAEGGDGAAQAAVDLRDAYAAAGRDVSGFDSILTDVADAQAIAAQRSSEGADAMGEFTSESGPAADAMGDLAGETHQAARETFDWAGALDDGIRSLADFYQLQSSAADAQASFRDTLRDFTRVQEQSSDGTLTGQERLDAFREVLVDGRDDILAATEALFRQGQTTEEVIPQIQAMADELAVAATEAGLSGDATSFLRGELGLLPEQIDLNIRSNVPTVLADFIQLRDAAKAFGFSDFSYFGKTTPLFGPNGFGGARAAGGTVSPDLAYLVGENGPEMFVPDWAGTIIPTAYTADLLESAGRPDTGAGQVVNLQIYNPIAEPASESMRKLSRLALELQ